MALRSKRSTVHFRCYTTTSGNYELCPRLSCTKGKRNFVWDATCCSLKKYQLADIPNPGCILEKDVDYRGHNILGGLGYKAGVTSAQACAELSLSKGVPFWTYQYSYQRCFVKSSDSKATILKGVISGTQACAFPQLAPLGVVASQRLNDSPPQLCADSNSTTFCVVEKARFPWIALYLGLKVRISRVEIRNRADCCGDKFRNIEVRVTDTLPNTGIFHTS